MLTLELAKQMGYDAFVLREVMNNKNKKVRIKEIYGGEK
jgi:hypothetical protein